jgi:hypothetical protein
MIPFLAQPNERRGVMESSNLVFWKWDQIFKAPMTAMAMVDRPSRAVIWECNGPGIREEKPKGCKSSLSALPGAKLGNTWALGFDLSDFSEPRGMWRGGGFCPGRGGQRRSRQILAASAPGCARNSATLRCVLRLPLRRPKFQTPRPHQQLKP